MPVQYYKVMYRTVGQWVPLADKVVDQTWYKWPTVSRGAQYLFQVYSYGNGSEGAPSKIITHYTVGKLTIGFLLQFKSWLKAILFVFKK